MGALREDDVVGKSRARASKFGSRLTGIAGPFGIGASWTPAVSDAAVAESLIRFLEDRRVLYASADVEVPHHCLESVLTIRHELTRVLQEGGIEEPLSGSVRAMRLACRKFFDRLRLNPAMNRFELIGDYDAHRGGSRSGLDDWVLNQAIGELRGVFGVHIALIAARYAVDVEEDLATILPPEDGVIDD